MHYIKRTVRAGVSCSSVVEHWRLKPGGLGLIPSDGWLFDFSLYSEHVFSVVSMVAAWYITCSVLGAWSM